MFESKKMTALQRVEKANVELISSRFTAAYSGVIMVGDYRISKDMPTAGTNGVDVIYGEDFVLGLKPAELRAIVMHETLHKTFQHMFLWKHLAKEDPRLINAATDYVINLIIKDIDVESNGFVRLPEPHLLDEKYRGMDSGQVYAALKKEFGGEDGGGKGKGKASKEDGKGKGQGKLGDPLDEHDWDTAEEMSHEEAEAVKNDIEQAIRQGQYIAGKMKGNQSRVLEELVAVKENWKEQLSEFVTEQMAGGDISTWEKPNRRWIHHDMYMPRTISETLGGIVIAVDLSGSVGQEEFMQFMSNVQAICTTMQPERVDLIYWDDGVTVHEVYKTEELDKLVSSTKPKGGGGTDPRCIPAFIQKLKLKPQCSVVLTDGYFGSCGEWDHPVLWGIVGDNRRIIEVGKTIRIKL